MLHVNVVRDNERKCFVHKNGTHERTAIISTQASSHGRHVGRQTHIHNTGVYLFMYVISNDQFNY